MTLPKKYGVNLSTNFCYGISWCSLQVSITAPAYLAKEKVGQYNVFRYFLPAIIFLFKLN